MKRKQRIQKKLHKNFYEFEINVNDQSSLHKGHNNFDGNGETHFLILLRNIKNIKINRLSIHRKINNLLKKEFSEGLHSIEIKII